MSVGFDFEQWPSGRGLSMQTKSPNVYTATRFLVPAHRLDMNLAFPPPPTLGNVNNARNFHLDP